MQSSELAAKAAAAATSAASAAGSWLLADRWSLAVFGVPAAVVLAAFAGAVAALSFLPSQPRRWWVPVVVATVAGAYLVPFAAHYLAVPHEAQLGVAVALGAAIEAFSARDVRAWVIAQLQRRIGGGAS